MGTDECLRSAFRDRAVDAEGLGAKGDGSPETGPGGPREPRRTVPGWIAEIERCYARPVPEDPLPWPARPEQHPTAFLHLIEPLARAGLERLRTFARELADRCDGSPLFDPERIDELFLGNLSDRVRGLLTRTLVLELQVARLEERLAGETGRERFESFVAGLRRPEVALEILGSYPMLAREVVRRVRLWEEVGREFLERLAADRSAIRSRFADGEDPGVLESIDGGVSDPHRGGRTVLILRFASGLELVYKPKPLAVDAAVQEILRWLDARGFEPAFRTLEVLDRGAYGWVERVRPAPCGSRREVRRFYRRQGAYLALLYLLEGTDFHQENLIAAGEHPVLVDLETLFHPRVNVADLERQEQLPGLGFYESVLRIGLLPERVWGDDDHAGIDFSGLGSSEGQESKPFWSPVREGTDAMRFERRPQVIPGVDNRPAVEGEPARAVDHVAEIEGGFRDLYRFLQRHRSDLLDPAGPLAPFADVEVRVVFRPTRAYAMLLMESFHPHVLGSAEDRGRHFERLWGALEERPFLEAIVPHERADLEQGDIPLFTTRPDSRDLFTSRGERLADFFPETGLDRARRRLERFGTQDFERQLWAVRGALSALALENGEGGRPSFDLVESRRPPGRDELLDAARAVGRRLDELAFWEGDRARWLSVQALGPGRWVQRPVPPDLYLGLPGIALFLGTLGDLAEDDDFTDLARAALAMQRWHVENVPEAIEGVGGFNGWGGLIYALTQLGSRWQDETLLEEAESLVPGLMEELQADESFDLLAGAAGGLLVLLGLHRVRPSEAVRSAAVACGEHLLEHAVPAGPGIGWVNRHAGPTPLAGMSHGIAGIALALLRLARETGDARFREAALDGLAYERSVYSAERRNWPDLREGAAEEAGLEGDDELHYMCAWCHGASGVGLARVAGLAELDDGTVRDEIAVAVETTLAEGFGDNHSLCHGALGNLEFLVQAAEATESASLRDRAGRIAGGVLRSIERDGWLYGQPEGAEPLGLMVGLAGIGYGLLRMAVPDEVPSVLTLEVPIDHEVASGRSSPGRSAGPLWDRNVEP